MKTRAITRWASLSLLALCWTTPGVSQTWTADNYQGIRLAQITPDLLDIVPGSEREIIPASAGMGEGVHLYRIRGKYYLTSAWYVGEMRLPTARADRLTGPSPRQGSRPRGAAKCARVPVGRA